MRFPNPCGYYRVSGARDGSGFPTAIQRDSVAELGIFPQPARRRSVEFQGYELCLLVAYVGQGVDVAAGEPFRVAGFEIAGHGALAYDVAAHLQVGYRYQQVRAGVVMAG